MRLREKIKCILCVALSVCIVSLALFCVGLRAGVCFDLPHDVAMLSARLCMPDASTSFTGDVVSDKGGNIPKKNTDSTPATVSQVMRSSNSHIGEASYPISELQLGGGNLDYDNFSVKNSSSYTPDIGGLLSEPLDFSIDSSHRAQVLIVHTHTCESYMSDDSSYYYESFYPRTTDNSKNVVAVGDAITDTLKKNGIGTVHATTQHDLTYDGSYARSWDTIMSMTEKYPDIKVVLDIHRDSMTADDLTKIKPTFTYNGKKCAQIMIMAGHDDGSGDFPTWRENLKFALKLQQTAESMYKGMTRPLYLGDFTYNMNVNSGSLLIEVGTDANTLDEAVRTGEMLANVLTQVLQNTR